MTATGKPFNIDKKQVFEAFKAVKSNGRLRSYTAGTGNAGASIRTSSLTSSVTAFDPAW